MKRTFLMAAVGVILLTANTMAQGAVGSTFGTLTTAKAMGQGVGDFGFGVGLGDHVTSFVGTFAYGLSGDSDGRLKFGLVDPDGGDTKFVFGADYKWQFWNYGPESKHPFDFALGGLLEYADYDAFSVLQLGGLLIASYPITFDNGSVLTPYGRFNARLEAISWDTPPGFTGDDSESNLEVGLSGGVQWQMTSNVALYGEFQLDGNDALFLGVDFNVM